MTHPAEYFDAIAAGARVAIETATAPRNGRPGGSQKSQKTQKSISEICEVFETPTELGIGEQLPSFPTDALPMWVAQFVHETAQSTQTPEDLAGMLTLTAVAVAVQGKYDVEVQPGYREQLSVYTQVVLPPGARKSTVFDKVARPILDYEMRLADQEAPRVAKRQTERAILEERLKHFRAKAAREENENEQRILIDKAGKLAEELARLPELFRPRFVADDVTPEQLATLMSQQGGRMAVLSSEGGIFQIMAGRYSSNGEANLDVFLKAYTGDSVTVDRANGRQHHIPHPTLSIGLTIQPSVLHGLIDGRNAAFRGRGLLGRFWYSLPPNLLGSRRVDPEPTRLETSTSYTTNLERLLQAEPWVDKDGAEQPRIITMDASALARFHDYSRSVEAKLAPGEALSSMTDWGGKLAGSVARICGLLHLGEGYDDRTPISEDIVERAVEIGEYLEAHAKAAYFEMGSDPVIEGARVVVEWLKRREETSFTRREAHQKHRARFKKLKDLIPVLDLLIDHGYIRPQPEKSATGKGRPPSPTYDVNPDWHRSENSENSTNQKAV